MSASGPIRDASEIEAVRREVTYNLNPAIQICGVAVPIS